MLQEVSRWSVYNLCCHLLLLLLFLLSVGKQLSGTLPPSTDLEYGRRLYITIHTPQINKKNVTFKQIKPINLSLLSSSGSAGRTWPARQSSVCVTWCRRGGAIEQLVLINTIIFNSNNIINYICIHFLLKYILLYIRSWLLNAISNWYPYC